MDLTRVKIGFAMCGSFCTFDKAFDTLEQLSKTGCEIIPIMSQVTYETDTRFGLAQDHIRRLEEITKKGIIHTIAQAEPIGPKSLLDALIIAPCTGNTLSKIATGITDSSVAMAAKAHLRNNKPVIIAISSNDALSGNAKNLGLLLNTRHVYFVPFIQDNPYDKPSSLIAKFDLTIKTVEKALEGKQLQPLLA